MKKIILSVCAIIEEENNNETIEEFIKTFNASQIELLFCFKNVDIDKSLIRKYKSFANILFIEKSFQSNGQCYQVMKDKSKGEYIHFTYVNNLYQKNKINDLLLFISDNDISIIKALDYNQTFPKYKFRNIEYRDYNEKLPKDVLYLQRYFFRSNIIKPYSFNEKYGNDSEYGFLMEVLSNNPLVKISNDICTINFHYFMRDFNHFVDQYDKSWYQESLTIFLKDMLEKGKKYSNNSKQLMQKFVISMIQVKLRSNLNARDKGIIKDDEVTNFYGNVKKLLQEISDDVLASSLEFKLIPRSLAYLLIQLKYDDFNSSAIIKQENNDIGYIILYKNTPVLEKKLTVEITAMNYNEHGLNIDGIFNDGYLFNKLDYNIFIYINDQYIPVNSNKIYSLKKVFNQTVQKNDTFSVLIPYNILKKSKYFNFVITIKGKNIIPTLTFKKAQSRLNKMRYNYWLYNDYVLSYSNNKSQINISQKKWYRVCLKEILYIISILVCKDNLVRDLKIVCLRFSYWLSKPKYKNKEIWLMYDKLYKAGDNAEYLFRYIMKQNDNIIPYYIINKNSNDYLRLKKEFPNNILEFNSFKNKLMTLHASFILATHSNAYSFCGYGKTLSQKMRGLLNAEVICIQHGLTIQKIAQFQNRLFDNTKRYYCASQFEIDNISQPIYGYDNSVLKLTGSPRYDGLKSNDKMQILITPTWRRNITIGGQKMGTSRAYNPLFKYTDYFKIYDSLINDEKLIRTAKKYNYKLIYLLHPIMSSQIDDFHKNEYVKIVQATSEISYEKILTESSLMVTDYSGVQFDFAYMKKPIIYYHPSILPPQYDEGGLIYDTMGFGPITVNHTEIVDTLCEYMENSCQMTEEYKKRVDNFFAYNDFNNCQRIYDDLMEYLKIIKKIK